MTSPQSVLRRFATGFHPRNSELLVYGSFALGAFLMLVSFTSGFIVFFPLGIVCLASTFYFQPFLDTKSAQLGADSRGIYIRGLGHIPWTSVEDFRIVRVAVRSVEVARLQLKLREDWRSTVSCPKYVPYQERLMFRIWRHRNENFIEVRLEHLDQSAFKIDEAITEIWQNRPTSMK